VAGELGKAAGHGCQEPRIWGWTARGYEVVRDAFAANLRVGEDIGAAVAVYRFGECVVDLWGGAVCQDGDPYPEDALQVVFSATKGLTTLCLAALVEDGLVDLERPVAAYWPEFGQGGKETITVRQLASHQAGLPAFDAPVGPAEIVAWDTCVELLAGQEPLWVPGSSHGYHPVTFGFLVGEVIRRASGLSVGKFFQERFARPLGLDAWIGLPRSAYGRVVPEVEAAVGDGIGRVFSDAEATAGTLTNRAFSNPTVDVATFGDPALFGAEIPAVNGICDARSLARAYSSVVEGPLRLLGSSVVDEMRKVVVDGPDRVLVDLPTRFGTGFMLASLREPMLGAGSFGHNGRGGSLAFAHPESGVAYGFVANRMVLEPGPDRRNTRLLSAVSLAVSGG